MVWLKMEEKNPVPDGVLNEIIMYGGGRMVEVLVDLLNIVLRSECCLEDEVRSWWFHSIKMVIGHYRGISLGYGVAKVFTRLLAWRWGIFARRKFPRVQVVSGVRRGIVCLEGLCDILKRERRYFYLDFLDISKVNV